MVWRFFQQCQSLLACGVSNLVVPLTAVCCQAMWSQESQAGNILHHCSVVLLTRHVIGFWKISSGVHESCLMRGQVRSLKDRAASWTPIQAVKKEGMQAMLQGCSLRAGHMTLQTLLTLYLAVQTALNQQTNMMLEVQDFDHRPNHPSSGSSSRLRQPPLADGLGLNVQLVGARSLQSPALHRCMWALLAECALQYYWLSYGAAACMQSGPFVFHTCFAEHQCRLWQPHAASTWLCCGAGIKRHVALCTCNKAVVDLFEAVIEALYKWSVDAALSRRECTAFHDNTLTSLHASCLHRLRWTTWKATLLKRRPCYTPIRPTLAGLLLLLLLLIHIRGRQ